MPVDQLVSSHGADKPVLCHPDYFFVELTKALDFDGSLVGKDLTCVPEMESANRSFHHCVDSLTIEGRRWARPKKIPPGVFKSTKVSVSRIDLISRLLLRRVVDVCSLNIISPSEPCPTAIPMKTWNTWSSLDEPELQISQVGTRIGSLGLGFGKILLGGTWSSLVAGRSPQITQVSDGLICRSMVTRKLSRVSTLQFLAAPPGHDGAGLVD
jgi:hypothetical protein